MHSLHLLSNFKFSCRLLPPTPTPGRHDDDEEVGLEEMITRHITDPWSREISLMSRPDLRAFKILRPHAAGEGTIDNMTDDAFQDVMYHRCGHLRPRFTARRRNHHRRIPFKT